MPYSEKITVLHLVHRYTVGGAEAVVNYLCRFSPPHVKNIICSFHQPDQDDSALSDFSTEIICLDKRNGNDLKAIIRLAGIIRDKHVDVVHAQGWATYIEGLVAAKLLSRQKCRFVYAFHGKTMKDVQNGITWRRRTAQKIASRFTDQIIAPSRQMAGDYAATTGLHGDQVVVIYNGIDLNFYGKRHPDARKQLGIEDDEFVIGFVGRLDPVKNLPGLFSAFRQLMDRLMLAGNTQSLRLLLVGDGAELSSLQQLADTLKIGEKVLFLGMRGDVSLCLSAMDIYVQPSFYEGHSNTILEAMAAGLSVISTNVGGTPEIIKHNHTGLLYPPDDYDGLAQAMFLLLRDDKKRKELAKDGQQIVKQKFSVETMVATYADLFGSLTGESPH